MGETGSGQCTVKTALVTQLGHWPVNDPEGGDGDGGKTLHFL